MTTTASRIPAIPGGLDGAALVGAINDRFRRVSAEVSGGSASSSAGVAQLVLTVPGVFGIESVAAPLVSLPASQTPVSIVALVEQGPVDGNIQLQLYAGSTPIGSVTIVEGALTGNGSAGVAIPANALVTLAITGVGLTYPGSGLTVMVRF